MTPTSPFQQSLQENAWQLNQPHFIMLRCSFGALELLYSFKGRIHLRCFAAYKNSEDNRKGILWNFFSEDTA